MSKVRRTLSPSKKRQSHARIGQHRRQGFGHAGVNRGGAEVEESVMATIAAPLARRPRNDSAVTSSTASRRLPKLITGVPAVENRAIGLFADPEIDALRPAGIINVVGLGDHHGFIARLLPILQVKRTHLLGVLGQ